MGNAACVCMQEVNPFWAQFMRDAAPRCAATPAIECFSQNCLMMIWRTDVLVLQGDVEVCRVFPDAADNSNDRRNFRVYLKAWVAKTKRVSMTHHICCRRPGITLAATQSLFFDGIDDELFENV